MDEGIIWLHRDLHPGETQGTRQRSRPGLPSRGRTLDPPHLPPTSRRVTGRPSWRQALGYSSYTTRWCPPRLYMGFIESHFLYRYITNKKTEWYWTDVHPLNAIYLTGAPACTYICPYNIIYWLVVSNPLKNINQLGWWHSQYMDK